MGVLVLAVMLAVEAAPRALRPADSAFAAQAAPEAFNPFSDFPETCPGHPARRRLEARQRRAAARRRAARRRPAFTGRVRTTTGSASARSAATAKQRRAAARRAAIARGRRLFRSTTAFAQRPSEGSQNRGERLSCASCHRGLARVDGKNHEVPTQRRRFAERQTPHLFRLEQTPGRTDPRADAGGFGWDGRFPCQQAVSKSAILTATEGNAGREPTLRELDDVVAFVSTLDAPDAVPGRDFNPALAAAGERVFFSERPVVDPGGEFETGERVACATCHRPPRLTDDRFHRILIPTGDPAADPGRVDPDGSDPGRTPPTVGPGGSLEQPATVEQGQITGFRTPVLRGLRLTAPYFHEGGSGDPSGTVRDPQPALEALVLFYDRRFSLNLTDDERRALVQYLLSL